MDRDSDSATSLIVAGAIVLLLLLLGGGAVMWFTFAARQQAALAEEAALAIERERALEREAAVRLEKEALDRVKAAHEKRPEKPKQTPAGGLNVGKCTQTGKREFNDDAIDVQELGHSTLCLVADGMGGIVDGKVLGQLATARAFQVLTRELKNQLVAETTPDKTRQIIGKAIVTANREIIAMAGKDPMGTTIVMALWRPGQGMFIAGVGDSRAYLIRGGKIEQLTVDHSLAQALVENKTITREEARTHRFRNVLWKYLGSKEVGDRIDVKLLPVQPGDRLLLCTDGLHGVVSDEHILKCMGQHALAQKCADALCDLALKAGTRDNVSAMVIQTAAKP